MSAGRALKRLRGFLLYVSDAALIPGEKNVEQMQMCPHELRGVNVNAFPNHVQVNGNELCTWKAA